ncbi:MAG: tetratricopeptide repeat protein, partial [Rhodothermales bacterium]
DDNDRYEGTAARRRRARPSAYPFIFRFAAILFGPTGAGRFRLSALTRVAAAALIFLAFLGCGHPASESGDDPSGFLNMEAQYVGDAACFDCHETQYYGFREHGMARSVHLLTPENTVEDFDAEPVYEAGSDLYYRAFERDGRFFQEEYRVNDDGVKTHSLVREMELVVGSGTAARAYVTVENGWHYALPLTWYARDQRWAMSPGYEARNLRFSRPITNRCMGCHNSYPESVPHAEGKFESMPAGIGCERCHGPGSLHVDARLSLPEPAGEVDSTIVNPAHLSLDRRLDVCQQCHLQATVSVLRKDRTVFDFRPSESLEDFVAFFAMPGEDEDAIEIISHASRMQQSECFIETRDWERPLECVSCHNPHEGFREAGPEYFNRTCRGCHADVQSASLSVDHSGDANCIACHMPRREAQDAPHASFTDHLIRVVEEEAGSEGDDSSDSGAVRPPTGRVMTAFYERDADEINIYRGIAHVIHGRETVNQALIDRGERILTEALAADPAFGEAHFHLGIARLLQDRVEDAVSALERAVELGPGIPDRLHALARAYEAIGRPDRSVESLLLEALEAQPSYTAARITYAGLLRRQNRLDEAGEQYELALAEQPWAEQAHNDFGAFLLRMGRYAEAESAHREAIHLNPDYVAALGNLGTLLARQGLTSEAAGFFERAAEAQPDNPVALVNLGNFLLSVDRAEDAVDVLERAVELRPGFAEALVSLARAYRGAGREDDAERTAARAEELAPDVFTR